MLAASNIDAFVSVFLIPLSLHCSSAYAKPCAAVHALFNLFLTFCDPMPPIPWTRQHVLYKVHFDAGDFFLTKRLAMTPADPLPQKRLLVFFRTSSGSEPVRAWLRELPESERRAIGKDLLRAQWRWPVGMPLCRPLGNGLWEIRTDLATKRTARVLICSSAAHLVALHGFIKKTRTTPQDDLALARKRQKELDS